MVWAVMSEDACSGGSNESWSRCSDGVGFTSRGLHTLRLEQIACCPMILEGCSCTYVRENQRQGRSTPPQTSSTYMDAFTNHHIYPLLFILTFAHARMYERTSARVGARPPRLVPHTWMHAQMIMSIYIYLYSHVRMQACMREPAPG